MPSSAIEAGVGAVGQVAGAALGGKGAKKVAKIEAQTADKQMAQTKQFYDDSVVRYQPDISSGNTALSTYNALLGQGGDPATANAAYDQWKGATGYQTTLQTAENAVNANAYAAGLGRSGAALKALQDHAGQIANGEFQTFLGNLQTPIQVGANAKAALSGAASQALTANNAATQSAGDASANAAAASAAGWAKALQNLGNLAGSGFGSSYGTAPPITNWTDGMAG